MEIIGTIGPGKGRLGWQSGKSGSASFKIHLGRDDMGNYYAVVPLIGTKETFGAIWKKTLTKLAKSKQVSG